VRIALDRFDGRDLSMSVTMLGGAGMLRIVALIVACLSFACRSPAFAQVTPQDESLQEQLVPESFKLEATAVAAKFNWLWNTTINYTIANNSGMNLYLGIMRGGVAIGSCTDAEEASGSLQFLPNPHAHVFSINPMQGPPRGAFVLAGARVAGAIVVSNCAAPNPGYPTAPLSISLMIGKTQAFQTMTTFPLSMNAPIRQLQSE
jgi:hypothetical protein